MALDWAIALAFFAVAGVSYEYGRTKRGKTMNGCEDDNNESWPTTKYPDA